MATRGLYRIRGNPPWVHVDYDGKASMPIPEDRYRSEGYQPPLDELPWNDERGTELPSGSSPKNSN
jgi:hypothetical protein